jgi:Ca2+-binding RTX toxin-like protein
MIFPGSIVPSIERSDTTGSGELGDGNVGYRLAANGAFTDEFTGEFGGHDVGISPPPFYTLNGTDPSTRTYTGNSSANTLTGTSAPEKFDGKGGSDAYNGSLGDDLYVISESGDRVSSDTGGQDTVEYWHVANYTLPSLVEHVIVQGTASRTVTGNARDNIMSFNGGGANTVTLNGGDGRDNIRVSSGNVDAIGGTGNDIFRYSLAAQGDGNTIRDFRLGEDLIDASALLAASTTPKTNPFSNGVFRLVNSGPDVKLIYDRDGTAGTSYTAAEVVQLTNIQIGTGIDEAHIYTGL